MKLFKKYTFLLLLSLASIQIIYSMNATNNKPPINPIAIIKDEKLPEDIRLKLIALADPEVKNTLATFDEQLNAIASKTNHLNIFAYSPLWLGKKDEAYFMRYYASEPDGLPIIDALLKNGISPDPEDRILNMSPLEIAQQYKHTTIVDRLKREYPENAQPVINESKKIAQNVMDLYKGNIIEVKKAIKNNQLSKDLFASIMKQTPIACVAAYLGHIDIILYLIEKHPPELNVLSKGSTHICDYAAQSGYKNILTALWSFFKNKNAINVFHCKHNKNYAPIHWACSSGSNNSIIWLIENGIDKSQKTGEKIDKSQIIDKKRNTLLHIAARNNHVHTIKLLLETYECTIDAMNEKDETPLNLACKKGHYNAVAFLLEHDAHTLSLYNNRSCFHNAASSGNLSIVELLLPKLEVNIDHIDQLGQTALLIAAQNHHADIVKYLIENGANPHCTDNYQQNALHRATSYDIYKSDPVDTVQVLIDNEVTINAQDPWKNTPLHRAVIGNYKKTVKLLLPNSADKNIENDVRETPLNLAVKIGDAEMIQLLMDHNS